MRQAFRLASALCVSAFAVQTQAEVLPVSGLVPANNDRVASLQSIVVDSFGGSEGAALTIRVEDVLRSLMFDGRPYFRVLPVATASGGEALLRGTANPDVQFQRYSEKRETCVEKDSGGKCLRKEKVDVACSKRKSILDVTMRIVLHDGTLIYSEDQPEVLEEASCEGDQKQPRSRSEVYRELVGRAAGRLRGEFVPRINAGDIRVDESRKLLSKPDADLFKQAVKLTKTDVRGACRIWSDLGRTNPQHQPTLFNIALCAESAGSGEAQAAYRAVLALAPNHTAASAGLARLDATDRARAQIAAHNRP